MCGKPKNEAQSGRLRPYCVCLPPLAGEPPLPVTCGAHLGLARVHYEWNDLDAAEEHGQQSVQLAQQLEQTDRNIACEVMLARLK